MDEKVKFSRPVPPFVRYCAATIPTVFDDSLSYYECLCALWKWLQDNLVDVINDNAAITEDLQIKVKELKEFVENYFANLDVQEEINNKLDEMAENGTLQEIVESAIAPYTEEIENLSKQGKNLVGEYIYSRLIDCRDNNGDFDSSVCKEQEGIVITGENKIVTFYSPTNIEETTPILVEEIDFSTPKNPSIIRSNAIVGLDHCNSACYNPTTKKIYVALAQYNDNGIVYVNKLATVDYNTLTLEEIRAVSDVTEFTKIAYDKDENKYYIFGENAVWELDIDTLGVTKVFDVDTNVIHGTQGLNVRNGYFYLQMAYPRAIVKLDNEGKIVSIYNIDQYDNEGHYIEFIADFDFIDDSNVLITPHCAGDYLEKSHYRYSFYVNYLCKLNLNGDNFTEPSADNLMVSRSLAVNTNGTTAGLYYENGSTSYPIRLLSSYLVNKYHKLYDFRINNQSGATIEYYGTPILENERLYVPANLTAQSCLILNSDIASANDITFTSTTERCEFYSSRIGADNLCITYNEASPINIANYCDFNVGRLTDGNNGFTTKMSLLGTRINRFLNSFIVRSSMPNQVLSATVTSSGTTCTADFSSYIGTMSSNGNFWPNAYLLYIKINSSTETLIYGRGQGFGDSRKIWDKAGNEYLVKLYNQTNKTITITGSNATDIGAVTMVTL